MSSKKTVKTVLRLIVLALAAMFLVHILLFDDKSLWWAVPPGLILGSALVHLALVARSKRRAV